MTDWGVWLHAIRPPRELARLAQSAEELGAKAVLVADEGTDRDLFVTLAELAHATQRIMLFGAVTNPHSRHPVALAAGYATLAELAPGRIVAGIGAGGSRVFDPMGLAPPRPFTALAECVDVAEALWQGATVDHAGEFHARQAALPWSPGRLPLAIAGRGPRVEQLAAERADWVLLSGRPVLTVADLVNRLRDVGQITRGRAAAIAWNPLTAWTDAMREDVRTHLSYMSVDMPHDPVRSETNLLERYAIVGDRSEVVDRLAHLCMDIRPELLVFDVGDYSIRYLEDLAQLFMEVGDAHGLDPHD